MINDNMFEAARRGAGLTQAKAASICGLSVDAYRTREKRAGEFRLKELKALSENMGESSQKVLSDAVLEFFLP